MCIMKSAIQKKCTWLNHTQILFTSHFISDSERLMLLRFCSTVFFWGLFLVCLAATCSPWPPSATASSIPSWPEMRWDFSKTVQGAKREWHHQYTMKTMIAWHSLTNLTYITSHFSFFVTCQQIQNLNIFLLSFGLVSEPKPPRTL